MPAVRCFTSRNLLTILAGAALAACATSVEVPPGALRAIVRFSASVDPGDSAFLARLSTLTGTSVRLSSLVSDREAAYWLRCTVRDPNCHNILGRLSSDPLIDGVQPDRYRYPTEPPR